MSECPFNRLRDVGLPALEEFGRWCKANPDKVARAQPEARRLLDERELLEGTGSKDAPRGIIAYGEPGYSIGFGPLRATPEDVEAMDAESWARESAHRAAFVAKREAKRARRLGLAQLESRASQNDTTRPDRA